MRTANEAYVHELKAAWLHLNRQYLEGIQTGQTSTQLQPIKDQLNDIITELEALEQDLDLCSSH